MITKLYVQLYHGSVAMSVDHSVNDVIVAVIKFKNSWKLWTAITSLIFQLKCQPQFSQIAKFMRPTWDPSGSCRPQMGAMLAPWNLLSWLNVGILISYLDIILHYHVLHLIKSGISDCFFICIAGWKITYNSQTIWHIFTKFHPQVHLGLVQDPIYFQKMNILVKMKKKKYANSDCHFICLVSTSLIVF